MPVEFLTLDQQRRYGRYVAAPDQAQLDRFFHLDAADLERVNIRRGEHNRLGYAVQLGTVRFLGTFLPDPTDVPPVVSEYLAQQLGIAHARVLSEYARRDATNREHAGEIQHAYGYRDFGDPDGQTQLRTWLVSRTAMSGERPSVLFDLATARLLEAKVLLPGPSTLMRLISSIRDRSNSQLWDTLAELPNAEQRDRLESLLLVPPGENTSVLDQLRRGPTSVTASGLLNALTRLADIRALAVSSLDVSAVSPARISALARYATAAKAQTVSRMSEQRRIATLLAAARHLEVVATDDVLDLLDQLLSGLLARANRAGQRDRLQTQPGRDAATIALRNAVRVLLDPPDGGMDALWVAISRTVSREQLTAAVAAVEDIDRPIVDVHLDDFLSRYNSVRRFLPALLSTLDLEAAPGGRDALAKFTALHTLEGRHAVRAEEVPLELATGSWLPRVRDSAGLLDRRAYTFLVLERLREALRRRDIYAMHSDRWGDPRAKLLAGPAWEAARHSVVESFGHDLDPHAELSALGRDLDTAYRAVAERLPDNAAVRIEVVDGRDRPVLTALDRLDTPLSLTNLSAAIQERLPRMDLPELLLEVAGWAGFLTEFTHVSEGAARAEDLDVSICAVLLAEACNIGLEPVTRPASRRSPAPDCPGPTRTTSGARRSPPRTRGSWMPKVRCRWPPRGGRGCRFRRRAPFRGSGPNPQRRP